MVLPSLPARQQKAMFATVLVGVACTLYLVYYAFQMTRWPRKADGSLDALTVAGWAIYGFLSDPCVFAVGPASVAVATQGARDGLVSVAPMMGAVCCGFCCALLYPILVINDVPMVAFGFTVVVKAVLLALGFFMIPAAVSEEQRQKQLWEENFERKYQL